MKTLAILNGPNLDRLGKREPHIYGSATLADLEAQLRAEFGTVAHLEFFQSNHEGALVDKIAALAGSGLRAVEVHISNIYKREEFRHKSFTAPVCVAVITGLGLEGYFAAVRYLLK